MFGGITINKRTIVLGVILSLLAAVFQLFPVIFSSKFIFITVFSALPLYIISRIDSKIGLAAYVIAGLLTTIASFNEGITFLLASGPLGYTLGVWSSYFEEKIYTCLVSGVVLTVTFGLMNYIIGIPFLLSQIPGGFFIQIPLFFLISVIYSYIYLYLSMFIYKIINRYLYLEYES